MKKRLKKKLQTEIFNTYRGIRMWKGWKGGYSYTAKGDETIMVMFPNVEGYARDFTHAKKCIDAWWKSTEARLYRHTQKHPNPECPF
jgi:hypothetical protein